MGQKSQETQAPVEAEAKFSVSGREAFERLKSMDRIAGYSISEGKTKEVHDFFLDTKDGSFSSAKYMCRRRESEGATIITIKGPSALKGGIHVREELECEIPDASLPVSEWPPGAVRDKLLSIIGDSPLTVLFEQRQKRFTCALRKEGREVAELSLDEVFVESNGRRKEYMELEAELKGDGAMQDLEKIAGELSQNPGLMPESRSKFERGLEFVSSE